MTNILQNYRQNIARKNLRKCGGWIAAVPFFFMALSMLFSLKSFAQPFAVKGIVTVSATPVRYASITFVNTSDTTKKFTALTDTSGYYQTDLLTLVKPNSNVPATFALAQNYPNPFSASTTISYSLGAQSDVRVTIYDILGREIKKFTVGVQAAGVHGVPWDGKNNFDERVTTGIYFYRLQANGETAVKKMVYGTGTGISSLPLPKIFSSQISGLDKGGSIDLQGGTFVVRIAFTDSTFPAITPTQINSIAIQRDTTLNFTVVSYVPQNAATISLTNTQQVIRGFGGANTLIFRPDMTPAEVQTAFGNGTEQVGMTIMRLSIPPDSTQFGANVPSALAAQKLGAVIIATPWTPPAWMKSNNSPNGGMLLPANYAAYAAHLKAFADTMAAYGVSLYGISVQNEPDFNASYQSCLWNATQFLNFMRYNAPAVGVPVFMPESESFTHQLSDSTLNDSLACVHTAFIGGHIYGATPSTYPLAFSKGKEQWMTEYLINSGSSSGSNPTSTDTGWAGAMQTAKSINDCMSANMSAYVWWYIVRFYGPIDDGTFNSTNTGHVTHKGYVMSQYAKFVRPGFTRVNATTNPQANVYVTAYKSGSKVVIVALNMGSSSVSQTFTIPNGTASVYGSYVTSSTKNCVEGDDLVISQGYLTATLAPSSVTTFVSY